MLGYAHATGDIHLSLDDVIPCAFHLTEQTLVARDAIQAQEAHKIHVEGVGMNVRLQFVNANLAIGYGVEAREGIPSTPLVYIGNHPFRPVEVFFLSSNLI